MEQNKIMTIHCASCGAPAQYDIRTQNYHCPYCGEETGMDIPLKELKEFRSLAKTAMEQELPDSQTIACECPNCGARVIVKEHEVAETCIFCQSKILRSDVQMGDGFPEVLIPFKRNRKQAEKALVEWIEKHPDQKESRILNENRKKLKGIYLPYELIKGPIRFQVSRDNSERRYVCGGFLEHVAVNVTDRCNNLLLNGMEPFTWDDLEPFRFGYIAGHAAEVPTADGAELRRRVFEEVAEEYRPTVEQTMQTTGLSLQPSAEALLRMPAFLPVYFMDCGEVQAAVNGQTGKVSVLAEKDTKTYPWIIEPLLGTIAVMIFIYFAFRNYGGVAMDPKELLELIGTIGLVAALILFTAFSNGRRARVKRKIYKSISVEEEQKKNRKKNRKKKEKPAMEPVFFENVQGRELPVQLGFYSKGRIAKMAILLLLINASTCLLAWVLTAIQCVRSGDWSLFSQLNYSSNVIWMCLSVPISLAGFVIFGRIQIYDSPVVYELLENGGRRRIHLKEERQKIRQARWKNVRYLLKNTEAKWILLIPLILYIMTVYMIMHP